MIVEAARAGRIGHKISRPPHHEMSKELEPRKTLFPDGVEQSDLTSFFYFSLGIGIVRFPVHQMIGFRVVLGVRVLPRVVRNEKYGV